MAIKIPSKNIYDINHKLPKTYIDKVESKNINLQYSVDYLTLVETKTHDLIADQSWKDNINNAQKTDNKELNVASANTIYKSYAHIETYYVTLDFIIDKYKNQKLYEILKLYEGLEKEDDKNSSYIKYSVKTNQYENSDVIIGAEGNIEFIYNNPITTTAEIKTSYTYNPPIVVVPEVTVGVENSTNINSAKFTQNDNNYEISLTILVGRKVWGYYTQNGGIANASSTYNEPLSLEVSFYGDIGQFEKVEIPLVFGSGNNVFETETNELLSSETGILKNISKPNYKILGKYGNVVYGEITIDESGYWKPISVIINGNEIGFSKTINNKIAFMGKVIGVEPYYIDVQILSGNANEKKANSIIEAYKNGKETLELLCSISEYSDTKGNLAISTKDSTKPMTFNIGDIALPYKFTAQGDQPLSRSKSNEPKLFLVTGVTPIFDGAVWQKITLQEV